ncbi:hypothetical protein GW17_00012119 [Ensete ventricosum]|uniref:Uncharacterized protein n=1 Tax=Ensete ventricosum TaxID=4639 RepID=A0A444FLY8_ENSVE|nr:hypothetical protein GW17_00012119 [Ensete ventricosum]RZR71318.1 hypothetical protein BHM03_00004607 [Ensete ventricosum]
MSEVLGSGVLVDRGARLGALLLASFVPEIFITSTTYHAIVLIHIVRGPCSEARALPTAAVAYRLYPCQVDRTIAGSSMPVSGRLRCGGSTILEI